MGFSYLEAYPRDIFYQAFSDNLEFLCMFFPKDLGMDTIFFDYHQAIGRRVGKLICYQRFIGFWFKLILGYIGEI